MFVEIKFYAGIGKYVDDRQYATMRQGYDGVLHRNFRHVLPKEYPNRTELESHGTPKLWL